MKSSTSELVKQGLFNIYTGGAKAPSPHVASPPTEGHSPIPSKSSFCRKMSANHAGIAGNQESSKIPNV